MPIITQIYRYPFKGMSPEALRRVSLEVAQPIHLDRSFALAHGTTQFNPAAPQHLPKTEFLMLMKNEKLAALTTVYDDSTGRFHIYQQGQEVAQGDLQEVEGQQAIEQFFVNYLGDEIRGQPKIVQAPEFMFSDVKEKVLSCINLASIRELEQVLGVTVDPLRFRANVYFDGLPAWQELEWVNREFMLGTAKMRVLKGIERCAATNVNPQTAVRDLSIPATLMNTYGHRQLGIYAQVIGAGEMAVGDHLNLIGPI